MAMNLSKVDTSHCHRAALRCGVPLWLLGGPAARVLWVCLLLVKGGDIIWPQSIYFSCLDISATHPSPPASVLFLFLHSWAHVLGHHFAARHTFFKAGHLSQALSPSNWLPSTPLPRVWWILFPCRREEGPGYHSADNFPRLLWSSLQLTGHSSGWNFLTEAIPLTKVEISLLQFRVQDVQRGRGDNSNGNRV